MAKYILKGKVLAKYGDNIDTDIIAPAIPERTREALAKVAMTPLDPDFPEKMRPGGILVAGKHFGAGSSRETAPVGLKAAGTKAIIADFFARIFYRNAINQGIPVVECKGASEKISEGDELEVNVKTGEIKNLTTGETLKGVPLPDFLLERVEKGGVMPYLKEMLQRKQVK